jgi:hypothetical protein
MRPRNRQKPEKPMAQEGTFRALWAQTKKQEGLDRVKRNLDGWL